MKKIIWIAFILGFSPLAKSQSVISNLTLVPDMKHYTVTNGNDSTFVKHLEFDLNDITQIGQIECIITNLTTNTPVHQKKYDFSKLSDNDLTIKGNANRVNQKVSISLGYLHYDNKNYKAAIKLYDNNNNIINSSDFNFSH